MAESSKFMDLQVEEILLRDMDVLEKTREELRSELKTKLGQEEHLRRLLARLQHCTPEEGVSFSFFSGFRAYSIWRIASNKNNNTVVC